MVFVKLKENDLLVSDVFFTQMAFAMQMQRRLSPPGIKPKGSYS